MDLKQRHKRIRRLVRKANEERKVQAQQIDILCNDFIGSQKEFLQILGTIGFTANFYESIMGIVDLNKLLYLAGKIIKNEITDASICFFLRAAGSFEFHITGSDKPISINKGSLKDCFSEELVDNICKANKVCSLDELVSMGLGGNPGYLNKLSAITVPLSLSGASLGFMLVYRSSDNELSDRELKTITAIAPGLYRAIQSCRDLSRSSK
jgi:hypothetical protein